MTLRNPGKTITFGRSYGVHDVPELPEVETMVRGIREAVTGTTVKDVVACRTRFRPIAIDPTIGRIRSRLQDATVTAVRRVAKRVVLDTSNAHCLVVEPRMTGLMLLADPPDEEHLRLRLDLEGIGGPITLWFWDRRGLGTATMYSRRRFDTELGPPRLGPDALAMTADEWWARCRGTKRVIKVAMLDQRFVAGIGNLYASEILHRAGIRPTRRANRLPRRSVDLLHAATLEILEQAIRYEGSTLSDGTYRNALNQDGGYQNHHRVYARADQNCTSCRSGRIERIVQAQRSTFFCPQCQR